MATFGGPVIVGYNGTATSYLRNQRRNLQCQLRSSGRLPGQRRIGHLRLGRGERLRRRRGWSSAAMPADATGGSVNLSGGTLSVTGNVTLGSNGGMGVLTRSGGAMTVSGNLVIGGNGVLVLDSTTGTVATHFGSVEQEQPRNPRHRAARRAISTPARRSASRHPPPRRTASLAVGPCVKVRARTPRAIILVSLASGGSYRLTTSGVYTDVNFTAASSTTVESISDTATISVTGNRTVYAMKASGTATLGSGSTLTLGSGGMILNGGLISGGTLAFGSGLNATPLIYAGTSNRGHDRLGRPEQSGAGQVRSRHAGALRPTTAGL